MVHIVTHIGENPHQCSTCDKYFAKMGILNTHLLTHTGQSQIHLKFVESIF